MNIVVSANNNKEIFIFPVIPRDLKPETPQNNEEFQTINNGTLNILGDEGLKTISIESMFFKEIKKWAKSGSVEGAKYIEFLNRYKKNKKIVRIVISTKDNEEVLNMECSIEKFDYSYDRVENIKYTLSLKEYRKISGVNG